LSDIEIALWIIQISVTFISILTSANIILYIFLQKRVLTLDLEPEGLKVSRNLRNFEKTWDKIMKGYLSVTVLILLLFWMSALFFLFESASPRIAFSISLGLIPAHMILSCILFSKSLQWKRKFHERKKDNCLNKIRIEKPP